MILRPLLVGIAVLSALALPGAPAEARRPALGLADDLAFADSRPEPRLAAFQTARRAGARTVRLTLDWSAVAPPGDSKPSSFDAADPDSPLYNWGYIEDAVRDAADSHLRVLLTVVRAPRWAEGDARPPGAAPGGWRPDPDELGAFLRAAARRFSGFFPDPKRPGDGLTSPGGSLPRVRHWQLWDEPNRASSLRPATPAHYRGLLNTGARALRQVSEENMVVAGGTAAAGALGFWRRLLCHEQQGCTPPARFDVLAHHPVSGRGPIAEGPLARLARELRQTGRRRMQIWLTDVGWATPPLAPNGVSPRRAARNLRVSLRRAGRVPEVRLVVWQGLQDRPTYLPGRFPTIASGLYRVGEDIGSARPKPALRVFRAFVP